MKFGVVVFPGSNCDKDMRDALANDLGQEVEMLWHKDQDISSFGIDDCIVLPGGFSFGDYLRCGAMARFSPIMESVIDFANRGGKVLGVCNGFQILCEAGLLPGALLVNSNQQFICKNIFLKKESNSASLTQLASDAALKIPIAHGEGRYYASDEVIKELKANDQILFSYCDENLQVNEDANPNGSLLNIAGITNSTRNVFGMMPHPERACSTMLGNTDGRDLFLGLINN